MPLNDEIRLNRFQLINYDIHLLYNQYQELEKIDSIRNQHICSIF